MDFIFALGKYLVTPLVCLLAAFLLAESIANFSAKVLFLLAYLPYFFFTVSALLCVQFNQSRMIFCLFCWFLLYVLLHSAQFSVFRLYEFVLIFLALINIAVLTQIPERSVLSVHSVIKMVVILFQIGMTWYLLTYQFLLVEKIVFSTQLPLLPVLPPPPSWINFSWLLVAAVSIGLLSTLIKFVMQPGPIHAAFVGFVLMLILLLVTESSQVWVISVGLTAAILTFVAVIFDSHQMAYRDELTGLRSRRALNQYLTGLGRKYTIAMMDIDHFKKFNDNHGHDIGDQMLKLVASRIAKVGGGGTPFRYGGEEFTVVFPRKEIDEVMDTLETLRDSIEGYPLVVRAKDRPKKAPDGKKKRDKKKNDKTSEILTCTISIGIANRDEDFKTPEQVIKGADLALYRAKEKGRNCLSV